MRLITLALSVAAPCLMLTVGVSGAADFYRGVSPSFCSDPHLKNVALPDFGGGTAASACYIGTGPAEITERFIGDDTMLTGVGFWFDMLFGLPVAPRFTIRMYDTAPDGCPLEAPLFVADCDVVEIGPGSGTASDPIEYFCDFSDNGVADFFTEGGVEYSISIQNRNCPEIEGEAAHWSSSTDDGIFGCFLGPDFGDPDWRSGAFSHDLAMYLCNEETAASVESEPQVGPTVMLSQPVPNPTTRAVTYSVNLERETQVTVEVFDVNGRIVSRPLHETLPAGVHSFVWSSVDGEGRNPPAGVYYLNLEAGGVKESRTFLLMP